MQSDRAEARLISKASPIALLDRSSTSSVAMISKEFDPEGGDTILIMFSPDTAETCHTDLLFEIAPISCQGFQFLRELRMYKFLMETSDGQAHRFSPEYRCDR